MNKIALALAVVALCAVSTAQAQTTHTQTSHIQTTAPVEVRERGTLTLENVPETPVEVGERLRQYVNTRSAAFLDFLPDGGILISTRFGDTAQIHRVSAPMGQRFQLTFYDEAVGGGDVRPGGGAFLMTRDVGGNENFGGYVQDLGSGRVTALTSPGSRNQGFVWSRDGRFIAWAFTPQNDPNYDIMIADPSDPEGRRKVLDGEGAVSVLDWSPDGRSLLIGQSISVAKSRRFVLDIASGVMTELAPDLDAAFDGGEFTPDGRAVILATDAGGEFLHLVQIDLETGERLRLSPETTWDVENFDLSPDGRTIAYAVNEAGQSRVRLLSVRSGRVERSLSLPPGVVGGVAWDDAGERIGFTLAAAAAPAEAYVYERRGARLTRWTQSEVGGLNPETFVAPSLIEWTSFDGRAITGFYYRPARAAARLPVIIDIHGGPEAQSRPVFSSTRQYWVNELGVAVITPNVRGSSGFGRTFLSLDNAERREDAVRDIGALLDWIETQPDLDPSRVLVYGGSYGGYMVLASMVHYNDRLSGAVNIVGISNFVTFLENTSGYRRALRRVEYGDESNPAMRDILERISPLTNIHRVSRPMFVIHGANDPRVPVSEAEQVVAAIRANNGEVWSMIASDEGHGFRRRVNQEAQREAETLFFQRVLGVAAAP
ncbi:MAG: prolyl oligopeptidase family serine peptidase [Alphaproteobacteria bacterium]|nr:prolyl oligopeptidase family serine peptidase [Alphaproteobacteria bacterium]